MFWMRPQDLAGRCVRVSGPVGSTRSYRLSVIDLESGQAIPNVTKLEIIADGTEQTFLTRLELSFPDADARQTVIVPCTFDLTAVVDLEHP